MKTLEQQVVDELRHVGCQQVSGATLHQAGFTPVGTKLQYYLKNHGTYLLVYERDTKRVGLYNLVPRENINLHLDD